MSVRCYGYVRLSNDERGEKKESLENQEDIFTRHAKENNFDFMGIYESVAIVVVVWYLIQNK